MHFHIIYKPGKIANKKYMDYNLDSEPRKDIFCIGQAMGSIMIALPKVPFFRM